MKRLLLWLPVLFLLWLAWQSNTPAQSALAVPSSAGSSAAAPYGEGGTTVRISVAGDGTQANGASGAASISSDGQWVAFYSAASNLTTDDANQFFDVFLHHIASGENMLVTRGWNGAPANWHSGFNFPAITLSADGGVVAFTSDATNLVQGDNGVASDCFAWERATGVIELISVNSEEQQVGNTYCELVDISGDGRYVIFAALNPYASGDDNGRHDIYLRDRLEGTTTRVTRDGVGYRHAAISDDGRYIFYYRDNFSTTDGIYRYDRAEKLHTLIHTVETTYAPGPEATVFEISGDGSAIVFGTLAENLPVPNRPGWDLFRFNYEKNEYALISERGISNPYGSYHMGLESVSTDGNHVLFTSSAPNIVPDQPETSEPQGYVRNHTLGYTQPIHLTYDGEWVEELIFFSNVGQSLSGDGLRAVFSSRSDALVVGDTNDAQDVFLRLLHPVPPPTPTPTLTPTRLPNALYLPLAGREPYWTTPRLTNLTANANGASSHPAISADGARVVFLSEASNLVPGDTNDRVDAFVWERADNTLRRISLTTTGAQASGHIKSVDISADGRYALLRTQARLDPRDTNNYMDVYRYDLTSGVMEWASIARDGSAPDQGIGSADISGDGRYVLLNTTARNITDIPLPTTCDQYNCLTLYRRDMQTGVTETWFLDEQGGALQPLLRGSLSYDGQSVAYGRPNGVMVYYDGATGIHHTITPPSATGGAEGAPEFSNGTNPLLAGNVPRVLYEQTTIFSDDQGGSWTNRLLTYDHTGSANGREIWYFVHAWTSGDPVEELIRLRNFTVSGDGARVAFAAPDLNGIREARPIIPHDRNEKQDVYRYDYASGRYELISIAPDGTQGNGHSFAPAISDDGRVIAFISEAANLIPGEPNWYPSIFVWEGQR